MKFSKKDFKKSYIPKDDNIEELYDADGEFGGDRPNKPFSDIYVDTQKSFDDTSDFETEIPQTSADFAALAKNTSNYDGLFNGGTPYYNSGVHENIRERVRSMAEEIVKNTPKSDFVKKTSYSDVNRNNIPDIDELENQAIIAKSKGFISSINSNQLNGEEIGILLNFILINIDIDNIPRDYKQILKRII